MTTHTVTPVEAVPSKTVEERLGDHGDCLALMSDAIDLLRHCVERLIDLDAGRGVATN